MNLSDMFVGLFPTWLDLVACLAAFDVRAGIVVIINCVLWQLARVMTW